MIAQQHDPQLTDRQKRRAHRAGLRLAVVV
jgi:hypothetical protein